MRGEAKNIGVGDVTSHGKLRWHSRRGMLELDVVLERFWTKFGDELAVEDEDELEILLELEDQDLLELVLDSEAGESASRVLQMLRLA